MLQRVLSPVLVGRQEELSQLEDALLSAKSRGRPLRSARGRGGNRQDAARDRAHAPGPQARRRSLGQLLGGGARPSYLPFVEAVGKHLDEQDPAALRTALGPTADELAQLFPQLAEGRRARPKAIPPRQSCASSNRS